MIAASYRAGTWMAISGPETWLLTELPPDDARVERCWSVISRRGELPELLDVLASCGVRSTPAFALVHVDGAQRWALARGTGSVTLETPGGPAVVVTGRPGQLSWAEAEFDADARTLLVAGDGPAASEVDMPMSAGVTMAAQIRVRLAEPEREQPAPPQDVAPVQAIRAEPAGGAPPYDHLFGATQLPTELVPDVVADEPLDDPPVNPEQTATWITMPPTPAPTPLLSPATGLIDGVPWAAPPVAEPIARPEPTGPSISVAPSEPPPDTSRTVDRSALQAQLATGGPTVLAGYCPAGHLTPPHAPRCRLCGAAMPVDQAGFEIARPPLGVLRLPSGDVVTLDRDVLLGRSPEVPADAAQRPHAVRLASPDNDISRTHAEVVLDGWHVYVRDLDSTNGTVVTLPGQPPLRLRPGDLQLLEHGATVTLAEVVTIGFEVVP